MSVPGEQPRVDRAYRIAAAAVAALLRLQGWRLRIEGAAVVPRRGGAVIAANHTSYWDMFLIAWHPYRRLGRPVRILAKASLFEIPIVGRVMRAAGHIPVDRATGRAAFRSAVEALRGGELVMVLPEQTISPSFELLPFRRGVARMAAMAEVPLIPAVSWGSHRFHTVGRRPRWMWRLPVAVRYGEPLHPSRRDDGDRVLAQLRERMQVLLDQAQRSYPDGTPAGAWWVPARLGGGAPEPAAAEAYLRALRDGWTRPSVPREGPA